MLLVYMQNCQPALLVFLDRKVKLVDIFKTTKLLNNRYAFYMLGSLDPKTPPLSVNAFCIVTNAIVPMKLQSTRHMYQHINANTIITKTNICLNKKAKYIHSAFKIYV